MASMNLNFDTLAVGTNINDIEVPPRLRARVDTGLPWLNFVKSGDSDLQGFVPGEVVLFTGTPGAGKSTTALQLTDSLSGRGHTALFNGCEESPAQTKMTYERMRLKNGFLMASSTFTTVPTGGNKDLRKQVGDNTLQAQLEELLKRYKRDNRHASRTPWSERSHMVCVVDSLQGMNDGTYGLAANSKTPIRVMEYLCNFAKEHFVTFVVIGHVGKSGEFKGDNTLLHMVDSHLHLYIDQDDKSPTVGCRVLECRKNRFGPGGISVVLDIGKNGLREHGSRAGGSPRGRRV